MRRNFLQLFILVMIGLIIYQAAQGRKSKEVFDPQHSKHIAEKFIENDFQRYKLYEKHRRFPDFVITGASKCGTDILKHYLHGNPYYNSDVHYFDKSTNYAKGPKWYMSLMPRVYPYHRVFEKTPSYFSMKKVPGRIFNFDPKTKVIILMCDPVKRALAHYITAESTIIINGTEHLRPRNFHFTGTSAEEGIVEALDKIFPDVVLDMMRMDPDFDEEEIREILYQYLSKNGDRKPANFITRGVFGYHIRHWFTFFPKNQILLLNEFDLKFNPWKVVEAVQKFTQVDPVITENNFWKNETSGWYCLKFRNEVSPNCAAHGPIGEEELLQRSFSDSTRRVLEKIFAAVQSDLNDLLGHTFNFRKSIYD